MLEKNSIYAFLTALFFAVLGISTKYIYKFEYMNADITLFYLVFFSTIILFITLLFKYKNLSFLKKLNKKQLMFSMFNTALFALFLSNLLILKSLQYIDPGIQKVLVYSNTIFIIAFNFVFWKIKLKSNDVCSLILMLAGLYLIIGGVTKSQNIILGVALSILAAIAIAIYSVVEENMITERPEALVGWLYSFLFATLYSFVLLMVKGKLGSLVYVFSSGTLLLLLVLVALICFVLPYLCFLKSIETIGATKTGVISSMSPVFTLILSGILFHEKLSILQLVGVGFIIMSSFLSAKK